MAATCRCCEGSFGWVLSLDREPEGEDVEGSSEPEGEADAGSESEESSSPSAEPQESTHADLRPELQEGMQEGLVHETQKPNQILH